MKYKTYSFQVQDEDTQFFIQNYFDKHNVNQSQFIRKAIVERIIRLQEEESNRFFKELDDHQNENK